MYSGTHFGSFRDKSFHAITRTSTDKETRTTRDKTRGKEHKVTDHNQSGGVGEIQMARYKKKLCDETKRTDEAWFSRLLQPLARIGFLL